MEILAKSAQDFGKRPDIFVAAIGETAQDLAFEWVQALRLRGIRAEMDVANRSLKSQMRRADKFGAPYVVIVGDRELEEGMAIFRDMATKDQEQIVLQEVVETAVTRVRASAVGSA